MRHPHTRQLFQEFNTEIVTEILKTDQDNIATMARIDPLGDDRGNVVYIIVMTKKEKGSHTHILEGLKGGNLSIISNIPGLGLGIKTSAILHREILNYHDIQCPVTPSQKATHKISRFSFSRRTVANGRIAFRMDDPRFHHWPFNPIIENRVSMNQKYQQT